MLLDALLGGKHVIETHDGHSALWSSCVLVANAPAFKAGRAPTPVRHVVYFMIINFLLARRSWVGSDTSRCTVFIIVCLDDFAFRLGQCVLNALCFEVEHLYVFRLASLCNDHAETTNRLTRRLLSSGS